MPGSPVLTLPADGTQRVGRRPRIEGQAEPGVPYVLLVLDGTLLARVAADAEGRFAYDVPSELSLGSHELSAYAELLGVHSTRSASHRFVVVKESEVPLPPELLPMELQVGCGCGSAPGAGLWAATLLLAAWAARRRQMR
jgi:MYXO-CTERM domain-containing protein